MNERKLQKKSFYENYPQCINIDTLNEIIASYIGIEQIIKLYLNGCGKYFDTRIALDSLSNRFNLQRVSTFKSLVKSYDMKYATVTTIDYQKKYYSSHVMKAISKP